MPIMDSVCSLLFLTGLLLAVTPSDLGVYGQSSTTTIAASGPTAAASGSTTTAGGSTTTVAGGSTTTTIFPPSTAPSNSSGCNIPALKTCVGTLPNSTTFFKIMPSQLPATCSAFQTATQCINALGTACSSIPAWVGGTNVYNDACGPGMAEFTQYQSCINTPAYYTAVIYCPGGIFWGNETVTLTLPQICASLQQLYQCAFNAGWVACGSQGGAAFSSRIYIEYVIGSTGINFCQLTAPTPPPNPLLLLLRTRAGAASFTSSITLNIVLLVLLAIYRAVR